MEQQQVEQAFRGWHYASHGDYHRNLDPNWSYAPTYLAKVAAVDRFIRSLPHGKRYLDVACGEGVLVEYYSKDGYDIKGVDLNYESEYVTRGNVTALEFNAESFDVAFFLDALEHIPFTDQNQALSELFRVLKPGGRLFLSVPNMAHLNSRFGMFFRGQLDRTDSELNHVGERPLAENVALIREAGFKIQRIFGITLTVPYVYRRVICAKPARYKWLHDAFEPVARAFPGIAMLSNFICEKPIP